MTNPRSQDVTELFACAIHTLWTGSGVDDTLRAAELLHATAAEITRKVRENDSSAGSHPDIIDALETAGIVDGDRCPVDDAPLVECANLHAIAEAKALSEDIKPLDNISFRWPWQD